MAKTFFLFEIKSVDGAEDDLVFLAQKEGEVTAVRAYLKGSEEFAAGRYRILQDTSGVLTKSVETKTQATLDFVPTFKRGPRQPKADRSTATEAAGKKGKGAK